MNRGSAGTQNGVTEPGTGGKRSGNYTTETAGLLSETDTASNAGVPDGEPAGPHYKAPSKLGAQFADQN